MLRKKMSRRMIEFLKSDIIQIVILFFKANPMALNSELIINKYEVVLFPNDFYTSDMNSFFEELKKELVDIFDGNNILFPFFPNVPRDIPLIVLKSKNNSISCNFSLNKVDFFWLNLKEEADFLTPVKDIEKVIKKITSILFRYTKKKIKRVGFIKEVFFESQNPAKAISNIILKEKLTNKMNSYFIRLGYNFSFDGISLPCNEIITVSDGVKQTGTKGKVVIFSKDINTSQKDDANWGLTEIMTFIKKSDEEKLKKDNMYSSIFE